jgi:transposase
MENKECLSKQEFLLLSDEEKWNQYRGIINSYEDESWNLIKQNSELKADIELKKLQIAALILKDKQLQNIAKELEAEAKKAKKEEKGAEIAAESGEKVKSELEIKLEKLEEEKAAAERKVKEKEENIKLMIEDKYGTSSETMVSIFRGKPEGVPTIEPRTEPAPVRGKTLEKLLNNPNVVHKKEIFKLDEKKDWTGWTRINDTFVKIEVSGLPELIVIDGVRETAVRFDPVKGVEKIKAEMPHDNFKGMYFTPSLAALSIIWKLNWGIPWYRQAKYFFDSYGIGRSQLYQLWHKSALLLEPFKDYLLKLLNKNPDKLMHTDDSPIKILDRRKQCYINFKTSGKHDKSQIAICTFLPNHGYDTFRETMKGFVGYIVGDGYKGWQNIDGIKVAACWAHIRRKFTDIVKILEPPSIPGSLAFKILKLINKLFEIERELDKGGFNEAKILRRREEESLPIINEIIELCNGTDIDRHSSLGKACNYVLNLGDTVFTYIYDAYLPIDNNRAERAVKVEVMSRKNFLFCITDDGATDLCTNLSIVLTATANKLDTMKYMKWLLEQPILGKKLSENATQEEIDQYEEELQKLCPWNPEVIKLFAQ